jgi:GNAT superfamily N-acetyltransferase
MKLQKITFEEINTLWSTQLWPGRTSPIETHSAMTWPFEGDQPSYDMSVFDWPATFWGIYVNDQLVAVNSGHRSSHQHYRSRGLWVDPSCRGQGFAQLLFAATEWQAKREGCAMIWSIPRQTALRSYLSHGFKTVGNFFVTETSEANIYVIKPL